LAGAVFDAEEPGSVRHSARGGIGKNAFEGFASHKGVAESGEGFGGVTQAGVFPLN